MLAGGSVSKRQDTRDQIDLLVVNALSRKTKHLRKKNLQKIEMSCFVRVFGCLIRKGNQMARTEIIQILMKHELADD